MLMLSVDGWINGLTAVGIFVVGGISGLFFIYQSKKTNAKLLRNLSVFLMLIMWVYWGVCFDFFTLLFAGTVWFPPGSIAEDIRTAFVWVSAGLISTEAIYIGIKLLYPKKKWYILSMIMIFNIIFIANLFIDVRGTIQNIYVNEIPLGYIIPGTLAHSALMVLIFGVLFFNVGGFLYKSFQSIGLLRKKFLLLALGFLFFSLFLGIEGLLSEVITLIVARIGTMVCFWIVYLGLREETEKPQKPLKKEIKVEGDLFRLIQNKPNDITEEEVSISIEKKICLVCKGKVGGFTFVCDECGAFYCDNCANAMINLENACWACNTPIDTTKPSKPYKNGKEGIEVNKLEETKKKLKE